VIRTGVLLGVGAVAGIWASHRVRQRVRALTPAGLADTLAASVDDARADARDFIADVRRAADVRERELLGALGVPRRPELAHDGPASGTIV
jgi:hypothetical protein